MQASGNPIVIVGGGVHGTALAMMLGRRLREAKSNQRVILVEKYESPNTMGSSHGDTRITRFSNAEAPFLTKTAIASAKEYSNLQHNFWFSSQDVFSKISRALVDRYGNDHLFHRNGLLMMAPQEGAGQAHNVPDFIQTTIDNAAALKIDHEVMDGQEAMERFPGYKVAEEDIDSTRAYYERDSGTLFPERCVYAQLAMAMHYGVEYRPHVELKGFRRKDQGVDLTFADDSGITASKVVLATGAWINGFLPQTMESYFSVQRQVMGWFHTEEPKLLMAPQAPNHIVFQRRTDGSLHYHYGFAINPYSQHPDMVKTAAETGARIGDPASPALREWHDGELNSIFDFASGFIRGLRRENAFGQSCRYTNDPDGRLIAAAYPVENSLDALTRSEKLSSMLPVTELQASDDIVVVSACSGHGFKNAMGLADAVAARMLDQQGQYGVDLGDYNWVPPLKDISIEALLATEKRLAGSGGQIKTAGDKPGGFKL